MVGKTSVKNLQLQQKAPQNIEKLFRVLMHIGLHQSSDLHEEKLPDKKEPNAMYYGEEKRAPYSNASTSSRVGYLHIG